MSKKRINCFFSHDADARTDFKIQRLIMDKGYEGYGIYWAIIESLRRSEDYYLDFDPMVLGYSLRVDESKVAEIIKDYDLFEFDTERQRFCSRSLIRRMMIADIHRINGIRSHLKRNGYVSKDELKELTNADVLRLSEMAKGLPSGTKLLQMSTNTRDQ